MAAPRLPKLRVPVPLLSSVLNCRALGSAIASVPCWMRVSPVKLPLQERQDAAAQFLQSAVESNPRAGSCSKGWSSRR